MRLDEPTTIMLGDENQEYVSHVLVQVSTPISDIILWELSAGFSESGRESIKNVKRIAEVKNIINPDNKVVISVQQENETLPQYGISYLNPLDEIHFMYISWSGEDSQPYLTEYSPDQKKLPE